MFFNPSIIFILLNYIVQLGHNLKASKQKEKCLNFIYYCERKTTITIVRSISWMKVYILIRILRIPIHKNSSSVASGCCIELRENSLVAGNACSSTSSCSLLSLRPHGCIKNYLNRKNIFPLCRPLCGSFEMVQSSI